MSSASIRKTSNYDRRMGSAGCPSPVCLLCLPIAAAPVNDTTKSVIVSFQYRDGTVTPAGSRVIYGYPPDNIANRDLLADLVQERTGVIGSYGIEDPRVMNIEIRARSRRRCAVFRHPAIRCRQATTLTSLTADEAETRDR